MDDASDFGGQTLLSGALFGWLCAECGYFFKAQEGE